MKVLGVLFGSGGEDTNTPGSYEPTQQLVYEGRCHHVLPSVFTSSDGASTALICPKIAAFHLPPYILLAVTALLMHFRRQPLPGPDMSQDRNCACGNRFIVCQ